MRCQQRRTGSIALGIAALLLLFLLPVRLPAGDTNYRNYLIGDRAAGMGGAVAASTADLDASYYNPAGLAAVAGSQISLSVSLYGVQRIRVLDGLGQGEHFKAQEFETIPSTFGSVLKAADDLSLAFAVLIPDKMNVNINHSFERRPDRPGVERSDYYSATYDNASTWIGPSLGWRASERLRVGAGAYLVYRSLVHKESWAYLYTDSETRAQLGVLSRDYNLSFSNYSVLGLFGAQYDLSDRIVLGAAVQTPSLDIHGRGELLYAVSLGDPELDFLARATGMKSRNRIPAQITAAAAWRKPREYTLEFNCTYHFPTAYDILSGKESWSGEPIAARMEKEPVVNFSLGGEYYVGEKYPVRAGVFTNLSSSPRIDRENPAESQDRVDMYGVSLGVGSESEHTSFSIGVNYVWGRGKTLGVGEAFEPTVVNQREGHLFVFVSSAYIF